MSSIPKKAKYEAMTNPYIQSLRDRNSIYIDYVPTEYADKATFENNTNLVAKDISVYSGLNTMALQTAGDLIQVTCKNKDLENILQYQLRLIKGFTRGRKSLIHNGLLYGLSLQMKKYREKVIPGTGLSWECIDSLQEVDRRRLRIEKNANTNYELYWTIWSPKHDAYIILENKNINPRASDEFSTQGYIWFIFEYDEESPYFYGLINIVYDLIVIRNDILQYWHALCEFWGEPTILAFLDETKAAIDNPIGSAHITIAERKAALIKAIQNMKKSKILVVDKGEQIKYAEHGSTGTNVLKEFIEYIDNKIQLLFLGAELTTKSGKSGSYALGAIHKEMTTGQIDYNRTLLCDTLKRDIIQDLIVRNQIQYKILGIDVDLDEIDLHITSAREEFKKDLAEQGIIETKAGIKEI